MSRKEGPGWSNCIFCGEPVGKADRSREHVLPMWMLRATGDPNRHIRIEIDPATGQDVIRPASTFHFPACSSCNQSYGTKLEAHAKKAMEALFAGKSLQVSQCYWLLDWLDKVRIAECRVLAHPRRQRVWALLQRACEEIMKADFVEL